MKGKKGGGGYESSPAEALEVRSIGTRMARLTVQKL